MRHSIKTENNFVSALVSFLMIISCHLPNRYIGSIMVPMISFALIAAAGLRLKTGRDLKKTYLCFSAGYMIILLSGIVQIYSFNNIVWFTVGLMAFFTAPAGILCLNNKGVYQSLRLFLLIEVVFVTGQYLYLVVQTKTLFVFSVMQSAGDDIGGTLNYSPTLTVSVAVLSFLFLYRYLLVKKKEDLVYFLLSMFVMVLPGMFSGILVYLVSLAIALVITVVWGFIKLKIQKIASILFSALVIVMIVVFATQYKNVQYGQRLITLVLSRHKPVKIKVIEESIELLKKEPGISIWGVGAGNYSSRGAFIVSGEYLTRQPSFIPVTPSRYTKKHILTYWGKHMYHSVVGGADGSSMINEPFIQYLSVLMEGGALALVFLLLALLTMCRFILQKGAKGFSVGLLGIYTVVLFFTNNWMEFPSFGIIFWMVLSYIFRDSEKREVPATDGCAFQSP